MAIWRECSTIPHLALMAKSSYQRERNRKRKLQRRRRRSSKTTARILWMSLVMILQIAVGWQVLTPVRKLCHRWSSATNFPNMSSNSWATNTIKHNSRTWPLPWIKILAAQLATSKIYPSITNNNRSKAIVFSFKIKWLSFNKTGFKSSNEQHNNSNNNSSRISQLPASPL